jgi:hypothetical protein
MTLWFDQINSQREKTMKIASMLSVAVGAGIAVAVVLVLGSLPASATPANGGALLHGTQQAEPVARYHIPKYRRCRADFKLDRYGHCVPNVNA